MVEKFIKECKKVKNLSTRETVEFLLHNTLMIDEEVYNYLKQMVLSQLHFDEHIEHLIQSDTQVEGVDEFFVMEDGTVQKMKKSEAIHYNLNRFFEMMNDIKQMNFQKFDKLLEFVLDYCNPNFQFTEDDIQFFKQHGNGDIYGGYSKLNQLVQSYNDSYQDKILVWRNIHECEEKLEKLKDQINVEKHEIDKINNELSGKGKTNFSKLKSLFLENNKRNLLKVNKQKHVKTFDSLTLELNKLESTLHELLNRYESPEKIREELIEVLDICRHLSENLFIRKKIDDLKIILSTETDLKETLCLLIPGVHYVIYSTSVLNAKSSFSPYVDVLFSDIDSQVKMNIGMYDENILKSQNFLSLIHHIRVQMKKNEIVSDFPISTEYRRQSLKKNNYIVGNSFSYEQITEAMNQLNEEFEQIKTTDNLEEYIRGCADIFQKFLMIHPFMDGNGRTSRVMLNAMMAQRNIFIPGVYNSYIERDSNSMFMLFGDQAAIKGNFKLFEDYLLAYVQRYNPNLISGDYSYLTQAYQELLIEKNNDDEIARKGGRK